MSALTTAEAMLRLRDDPRPALFFEDEVVTWVELMQRGADRAALALSLRNDEKPFHIAVLLENDPEYVYWIVAAALSGAAIVGVNPTRRGAELRHDVEHTDCQLLVTSSGQDSSGDDLGFSGDRCLVVDTDGYAARLAPFVGSPIDEVRQQIDPTAPLFLLFTSGSTGAPKAVLCSQARFAGMIQSGPERFGVDENDVFYNCMPMFHGNALMASWTLSLGTGAPWALRRKFSASNFLGDVRKYGATYFNYVGRALAYVLATPEEADDGDNQLRLAFGTEATDRDMTEFSRRFGCEFRESYGSSEGPIVIAKTPDTPSLALGQAREGDVAVVDPETGEECPRAEFGDDGRLLNHEAIGEIVRRDGANLFEGYYNNDEASAKRLRDGWYWSDDLAYVDSDGYFYFAGRGADWLRVDSENFSATPIERIISRHPDVLVCAVYPVPDAHTGDQVMAAIELVDGSNLTAKELDGFLAEQPDLGTKWSPRFVRIVGSMPLTGSNKIDKKPLRALAWNATPRSDQTTASLWWCPTTAEPLQMMTEEDREVLTGQFDHNGRLHLMPRST